MKEVIWVYGTSAAGKETFIKSLLSNSDLRHRLRLDDQFTVSNESFINLGKLDGSRESIIEEVSKLSESHDAVVIKWQYGDTLLNSPNRLHEKLPAFKHRVINLHVDEAEQIRRLRTKSWWHDDGKEKRFISRELQLVDESLKQLNLGITITQHDW